MFGADRELRNKYAASVSLAPKSNGQNTGRPSVARNINMKWKLHTYYLTPATFEFDNQAFYHEWPPSWPKPWT